MFKNIGKLFLAGCISATVSVPMFADTELTGTVTPLNVSERAAGTDTAYPGVLSHVIGLGTIAYPYITRQNDDIIVQVGTPLYTYDMAWWNAYFKQAKDTYAATVVELDIAKKNVTRYKELVKTNAENQEVLEGYLAAYATALGNYENAKATIPFNFEAVREATCRPTFEGICTKIYQSCGLQVGQPILEFTQLNPIGINVKMDRAQARKLSGKPVKIYPVGVDKAQGIIYGRTMLTDDGVQLVTENNPESYLTDPGFKIRIHRDCSSVVNFHMVDIDKKDTILAVREFSIQKDDKGYFVWRAKGQQELNASAGLDNTFTIEKVYVTPGNLFRRADGWADLQSLNDAGSLKLKDLVLAHPPADLKEGEEIFFPSKNYVLMPGDQVKVVIGN